MKFNIKTAAMFGLDARIALAIFGALSVISGAALYSAISHTQAVSLLTQMKEVGKAVEQYLLDTGLTPDQFDTANPSNNSFYTLNADQLVSDTKAGWQGPYLPYTYTSPFLNFNSNDKIYLFLLSKDITWGGATAWTTGRCTGTRTCGIWVHIQNVKNSTSLKIDEMVDNSDGPDAGLYRWLSPVNGIANNFLYINPTKNPNL